MAITAIQRQVRKLLLNGNPLTSAMITELINDHRATAHKTKSLHDRYKASKSGVPIFTRQMPNVQKINSKINNDFFGEIVDTKVGYVVGKPISYYLDKNAYDFDNQFKSTDFDKHSFIVSNFTIRNNVQDLDVELVKLVSICGHAGREIYLDKDGNERIANLKPYEVIFLTDSQGKVDFALRYYKETLLDGTCLTKVEFFDKDNVTYYTENDGDTNTSGDFILDGNYAINPNPHLFDSTPIVKIVNNEEELGDADKVLELIDAYDRAVSDVNSEIEQFRLAYMYFKGQEPTAETIEQARQTGAYYVGESGEVGFITKNINDAVIEHHLDRLEQNILRFAKHVNFGDEQFGGNLSGVAMRYKLFALESKSMILETKLQSALRQQFDIITSTWSKRGISIDYLNLIFGFKRNLPVNLLDEASSSEKLKGLVSEHTRLSQLSFIDDVEYEIKLMEADAETYKVTLTEDEPEVEDNYNLDVEESDVEEEVGV